MSEIEKIVHWCEPSTDTESYTPGSNVRGCDKRANGLQTNYRWKARKVHQSVLGIDREERGPGKLERYFMI